MNSKDTYQETPKASELVEAEALAWVAQLNGDDVTEKDLAAFREWVRRSPAHEKEIRELAAFWDDLNILVTMDEPIRQADAISRSLRRREKFQSRRLGYALAGFALIALIFTSQFTPLNWNEKNTAQPTQIAQVAVPIIYKTAVGEQQQYKLEDGSVLTLNTNSHVEIDFTEKQRNIRLLKGEGLFTVTHDKDRPFVVFAESGIVRALGTEFSVRLRDEGLDVIVSEGSVELSSIKLIKDEDAKEPVKVASLGVVEAGQSAKMKYADKAIQLNQVEDVSVKHSWQNGNIIFTGETLDYVVAEVGRYTNLKIIIDDPDIMNRRFGGVLKSGQTDQLFQILEIQYGIIATPLNDHTIRLDRNH